MLSKTALLSLLPAVYGAVHESLESLPHGWRESKHSVPGNAAVQLQVALKYRNLDSLDSRLMAVSDPDSKDYGKYLELEEMNTIFQPTSETESKVSNWLKKAGARNLQSDGSMLTFYTSVDEANRMLDTEFKYYTNGDHTKLRATRYSVPDDLVDAIDLINPTTYFGGSKTDYIDVSKSLNKQPTGTSPSKSCETTHTFQTSHGPVTIPLITPECVRELYSIGNYTPDASKGSTVAFGSFLNESASHSDLKKFQQTLNIPTHDFQVLKLIRGGVDDQNPLTESDGEADLDVEEIAGIVGDLPIGEYITGGIAGPFHGDLLTPNKSTEENEPYLVYYQYLLSQNSSNLPWVISNSYGDHEYTVPLKYAQRVCNQIGMMGMRGRTILESTGDEGVGAVCLSANGKKPEFTATFPPSCPYVTAVGGTQAFSPEHAWNASSGGFSNYFGIPSYQKSAVNTYLTQHISSSTKQYYSSNGYANFSGRGFPDISAHSLYPYYYNIINGSIAANGGTSAASPVVAGIIALLNDARFRANKPALGFLNPFLYKSSTIAALNDITLGGSKGCHGTDLQSGQKVPGAGHIKYASWNATKGWDPVTGLGTPNFEKLRQLVLQ